MVKASGQRAVSRCDELGLPPYSAMENGLFRAYLTSAHAAAVNRTAQWMMEAGMDVRMDSAANLIGRYEASVPGAKTLLIGSHIDSVKDAGCYDGPLGIMLGIECVQHLHNENRRLPFAIEVIAFGDEEGSRFHASMLCSRALTRELTTEELQISDAAETTLFAAYQHCRPLFDIEPPMRPFIETRYDAQDLIGYLEPHIEQGPVLEAENLALAAVTGIAAQLRYSVTITGTAGHAGTCAMNLRQDALAGAAEMMLAIEELALSNPTDLVATVGKIEAAPGATNVVPGRVVMSLDVRSGDEGVRDQAAWDIVAVAEAIAARRNLKVSFEKVQDLASSPCDVVLTDLLETAIGNVGLSKRRLVSGAGHDAMVVAALCPTAMLFIRCEGGISHNPAEAVYAEDADSALAVMLEFLDLLEARNHG